MKWIKKFESYSRKSIESDIAGLIVDLFDEDFDVRISWYDEGSFELDFKKENSFGGYKPFHLSEIEQKCLTIIDYVKDTLPKSSYLYIIGDRSYNEISFDKEVLLLKLYFQNNT